MIIHRNYEQTENDDFKLNVEKHLDSKNEAVPLYYQQEDNKFIIVAWKIQPRGE